MASFSSAHCTSHMLAICSGGGNRTKSVEKVARLNAAQCTMKSTSASVHRQGEVAAQKLAHVAKTLHAAPNTTCGAAPSAASCTHAPTLHRCAYSVASGLGSLFKSAIRWEISQSMASARGKSAASKCGAFCTNSRWHLSASSWYALTHASKGVVHARPLVVSKTSSTAAILELGFEVTMEGSSSKTRVSMGSVISRLSEPCEKHSKKMIAANLSTKQQKNNNTFI